MCAGGMLKVLLRSRIETDKEVVMKQNGTMTWKTDEEVETDPVFRDHISGRSEYNLDVCFYNVYPLVICLIMAAANAGTLIFEPLGPYLACFVQLVCL